VFDKNLIGKILEDHNLPGQIAKYLEEDKVKAINNAVDEMLGLRPPEWILISKITQTIMQLASMGNVVIVGRGANVITHSLPNVLHVRLVAPLPDRIKHIQEKFDLTEKAALERIKKDDAMRREYLFHNFHKEIDDHYLYHLIINTHLIPYDEAAELISSYVVNKFPQFF
jgi:cytidylate kinase